MINPSIYAALAEALGRLEGRLDAHLLTEHPQEARP